MGVTHKTDGKYSAGAAGAAAAGSSGSGGSGPSSSSWSSNSSSGSQRGKSSAEPPIQGAREDDSFRGYKSHDQSSVPRDTLGGSRFYFGLGVLLVFGFYVYYSIAQIPTQLELERDAALERQRRAQAGAGGPAQRSPFDDA